MLARLKHTSSWRKLKYIMVLPEQNNKSWKIFSTKIRVVNILFRLMSTPQCVLYLFPRTKLKQIYCHNRQVMCTNGSIIFRLKRNSKLLSSWKFDLFPIPEITRIMKQQQPAVFFFFFTKKESWKSSLRYLLRTTLKWKKKKKKINDEKCSIHFVSHQLLSRTYQLSPYSLSSLFPKQECFLPRSIRI